MNVNTSLMMDSLLLEFFIKYDRLKEIISKSYTGSTSTKINLFIDLNSVLRKAYTADKWVYQCTSKYGLDIAGNAINMCAHYREFFRRLGVECRIFVVNGDNIPSENEEFVIDYNGKYAREISKKTDTRNQIRKNLSVLEPFIMYLPDIYYYDFGTNEVSAAIYMLITKLKLEQEDCLVLTKDILALQLVSDKCRILRPFKTKTGDESFIVDKSNFWPMLMLQYRKLKCPKPALLIGTSYISNILAMSRVPERNMKSVMAVKSAYEIILQGILAHYIPYDQPTNQGTINSVLISFGRNYNWDNLINRWKAVDIRFQSNFIIPSNNIKYKYGIEMVNLSDPQAVREMAGKYFNDIPLDLDRL